MQNPKTGGSRWVPDIRPENIDTYTEQNENQSADYKIVDAHPIIGGVLDKLAFFRTHASAVWYNKMKNITVLQKLDNLAANIGTLANLATTDKTSLVNAVNELNEKIIKSVIIIKKSIALQTGENVVVTWQDLQEQGVFLSNYGRQIISVRGKYGTYSLPSFPPIHPEIGTVNNSYIIGSLVSGDGIILVAQSGDWPARPAVFIIEYVTYDPYA